MPNEQDSMFLNPLDAKARRDLARRNAKMRKFFGPGSDPHGKSQARLQRELAVRHEAEQKAKAERERSLLNTRPPQRAVVKGRAFQGFRRTS